MAEPLATTEDYETHRNDPDGDRPVGLVRALEMASDRFRQEADGQLIHHVADDEVVLDSVGGPVLLLPQVPVTEVSSVVVDGEAVDDFEWSERGILRRARGWPRGLRAVTVTYSHGFAEIPGDVVDAVCEMAAMRCETDSWVRTAQVGTQSFTFNTDPATALAVARRYRA